MATFIRENIFLVLFLLSIIGGVLYMYLFSSCKPNLQSLRKLFMMVMTWTLGAVFFFLHTISPNHHFPTFIKIVTFIIAILFLACAMILFFTIRKIEKEKNEENGS